MKGKFAKHFTEEQIQKFKADPNVRYVDDHTIRFIYEFRIKLYEAWEQEKRQGVKRILTENGYSLKELGRRVIDTLCGSFKKRGRPTYAKSNLPVGVRSYHRIDSANNEYLLSTGMFVKSKYGKGITFSDEFRNQLFKAYPEQTIEDGIRNAGIDPEKVGYPRIYALQRMFEGGSTFPRRVSYPDTIIEKYSDHPYIKSITAKKIRFSESFYNEASFLVEIMKVNEILELYEIDPIDIPISVQVSLKYKLIHWKRTDEQCKDITPQVLRIQQRRYRKLTELVEERFRKIREEELPAMDFIQKKKLCYWIQGYPIDPMKIVNTSYLLKKIGISRSSYYSILRNNSYGISQKMRDEQDDKDIEIIKTVMDYRGFRKGIRQIYMMMDDLTGYHFSLNKIKRLMKKYDIRSGIREKKQSRIEARQNLEEHKKPNLLKRRFRAARPNTHTLTDVTYIPYGDHKLAYASAVKDAVTGRMYDLTISECNDLNLVISSLNSLKDIDFKPGAIFHSDQGALYLTDTYQNSIKDLGLEQSMSKRGNCWDNAPQESFFALFKTETAYQDCSDIIELEVLCSNYMDYFNNERRQWDRRRMTPMEYETYMNDLTDDEFNRYMKIEKKKYRQMKKRAAEQAIQRAQTLGV